MEFFDGFEFDEQEREAQGAAESRDELRRALAALEGR